MNPLTRRYKFEIFPSPVQKRHLGKIFGSVRFVYNEFLKISEELYADRIQKLSRTEMQEHLLIWKEAIDWLSDVPSQSLQVATHDLDVAYQNLFAGRGKRPRLKKKLAAQSFSLPQPKIKSVSGQTCVFIPKYKTCIPMKMHREFPDGAKFGAATISKTASGRYFVSIVTKFNTKEKILSTHDGIVGVDLNIKHIVLSDGEKIQVPRALETLESRKRRLQKKMQRQRDMQKSEKREDRSNNYEKTRFRLAKLHERIRFQREDYLHKLALNIYRKNQVVAMETLNVKGMMKNRRLAKSIAFQSWGRLVEIMKMYAVQYDKHLHFISTWFPSSKMCHQCGFVNSELTLSDREWTCESCQTHHDRDINAAINIQNEGGSYPVHQPVERKGSVVRPKGRPTTMASAKQESSRFEVAS